MNRSAEGPSSPFQRLPGSFRLKKQSLIRPLFDRNRDDVGSIARGSVRLLYRVVSRLEAPSDVPIQVAFAPGRTGSAVRRNRVKRVLREVYRANQQRLIDLFSGRRVLLTLMILYRGRNEAAADEIRRDLPRALQELERLLGESSTPNSTL